MSFANDTQSMGWNFDHSYRALPSAFFSEVLPTPGPEPRLIIFNDKLAQELGLNCSGCAEMLVAATFCGNILPTNSHPIAQAYAGHQFGHFTMLGDGRAILLGEHITPSGKRVDVQLKGAGLTPYSRRGDGKAAIGPMLREYIISEALNTLVVPTTRSLAVVATGENIYRENILKGAILTRVASSHIRVGTFQYAAALKDKRSLKELADYTISRHYSQLIGSKNPYRDFLHAVIERQAALVSQWMLIGFIHGVMNTDNMTLSGESIDYGPCAFLDSYQPKTVYSSIDQYGRYAYQNQPDIAQWNLARFSEALLPLIDDDINKAITIAEEEVGLFAHLFRSYWLAGMRKKLGLFSQEPEDIKLSYDLLEWMDRVSADYTNTFRALASENAPKGEIYQDRVFQDWRAQWLARLERNPKPKESSFCLMNATNPAIIPRNEHVEAALTEANEGLDLSKLQRLLTALADPFREDPSFTDLQNVSSPSNGCYKTFCGT